MLSWIMKVLPRLSKGNKSLLLGFRNLHWILQWNAQQQMVKQDDLAQSINITEMVYFPIQRIDLHFDLIPGMKKPCTVLNKNER